MTATPDPAALHAARERVVRLLTDRYADDTLTVEEFEARLDRMHATTDPVELDAMARALEPAAAGGVRPSELRDAPAAPSPAAWWAPEGATAPPVAAPYARAGHLQDGPARGGYQPAMHPQAGYAPCAVEGRPAEGRVMAVMSAVKRRGAWVVPRRVVAVAVMGEVRLDLREAALAGDCDIEIFALMGNVRVILPLGAEAHVDVDVVMGNADDRTRARLYGIPGAGPRIRVTGTAIMAEVRVDGG